MATSPNVKTNHGHRRPVAVRPADDSAGGTFVHVNDTYTGAAVPASDAVARKLEEVHYSGESCKMLLLWSVV